MTAPDPVGPPQEVEFKLLAPQRLAAHDVEAAARALGVEVGPGRTVRQLDRYLDTEALDLLRHGGALRVRGQGPSAKLCFKSRAEPEGDAVRRTELEESTPDAADPVHAWDLPLLLRNWVEPITLARPMHEIASLENQRLRHALREPVSGGRAELCIDRVRVVSSRGVVGSFVEVEIETTSGPSEAFAPLAETLVDRLGLEISQPSKLERALLAAGRSIPRGSARKPSLTPGMALREAAARVFRVHLETLRRAEPVARMGEDDEGVHRMRVSARRMRAAFRVFGEAFPPGRLDSAQRLFRGTGRALGNVRDLDVMLKRLPALSLELPEPLAGELEPLFGLLVELRDAERRRMMGYLGSRSRLRAAERFERFVERAELRYGIGRGERPRRRRRGPGEQPVGELAPVLLRRAAQRVFKRGDKVRKSSPPEALHALRIAVKRLRYTAESLSELVPDDLAAWLRRTAELQEVLGAYNDARVMEARLTAWVESPKGRRLPRRTLLAVGGLLGVQERRAREARRAFRREWREFSKEKWRRRVLGSLGETPA